RLEVDDIGGVHRVGRVVGEGAVQLEVEGDDLQGEGVQELVAEDRGHRVSAHSVARVHHDFECANPGKVHELAQVRGVVGEQVPLGDGSARAVVGGDALFDEFPDLRQPGLHADGR